MLCRKLLSVTFIGLIACAALASETDPQQEELWARYQLALSQHDQGAAPRIPPVDPKTTLPPGYDPASDPNNSQQWIDLLIADALADDGLPTPVTADEAKAALRLGANPDLAWFMYVYGDTVRVIYECQDLHKVFSINYTNLRNTLLDSPPSPTQDGVTFSQLNTLPLVYPPFFDKYTQFTSITFLNMTHQMPFSSKALRLMAAHPFFSSVKMLFMQQSTVVGIPEEVRVFSHLNLSVLFINNMKLKFIAPGLSALTHLWWLDISGNQLTELDPNIGLMKNLAVLTLGKVDNVAGPVGNCLTSLPESITQLENLSTLEIAGNPFPKFPIQLKQGIFPQLQTLDISGCGLTQLPAEIGVLQSLATLTASYNALKSLPKELRLLTRLAFLDLSHNKDYFDNDIDVLCQITSLCQLNLNYSNVRLLPAEISNLKALWWLNVAENALEFVPYSIGELTALKFLGLSQKYPSGPLKALPQSVVSLTALCELDIRNCPIATLPAALNRTTLQILGFNGQFVGGSWLGSCVAQ